MQEIAGEITILHVDDDPDFVELAARFLEREDDDFTVMTATTAAEGLAYVAEHDVDCIVSDYELPDRDGIEFLKEVRDSMGGLPFILFTGKGSEAVASESISAGVTDYLQKIRGTGQYTVLANRIRNAVSQKRAEALADRAFNALDRSREGIALLDDEGEFIYVNEAYAEITGYADDELIGESWERVYPDEQVDRVDTEILPAVPREGHWTGDTVYERRDGNRIRVNHAITYSDEGTLVCLLRDVADMEAHRQALYEERQRFDLFVDAVEDYAMYMLDPDGYVVTWNNGAEEILGYSKTEILGEHFSRFFTEAQCDGGLPEDLLTAARADGAVEQQGLRVRQDESTFDADVVLTAVYDEDGAHRGFGEVMRDISAQEVRDEATLRDERFHHRMHEIVADSGRDEMEKIQELLALGCERLGVENGHVVEIDGTTDRPKLQVSTGTDLPSGTDSRELLATLWRETMDATGVLAMPDVTEADDEEGTAGESGAIGSYLGANLSIQDAPFGAVGFVSREPRSESFTDAAKEVVDLIARWVGSVYERREHLIELRVKDHAIDAAPIGITLADADQPDNPLVYANETFESISGYSAEEIEGKNCRILQGGDTDSESVAEMRAAIDRQNPVSVTLLNYRKNGEPFINKVRIAPVEDDTGDVTHFVGFQEDVTMSSRREQAISALHGVTRELITAEAAEEIAEIIMNVAVDILDLPQTGVHLHDEERSALVPVCWTDRVSDTIGDPPALGESSLAWDVFESGESRVIDDLATATEIHNPDTPLQSELIAPIGDHGVVIAGSTSRAAFTEMDRQFVELLCANASVALDRLTREQLLVERERDLAEKNQRLEEFARVVTHDLRNPLSVAKGRLEMVGDEHPDEHVAAVREALDRMERIIEDVLWLAREGRDIGATEPVDFASVTTAAWRTVANERGDAEMTVTIEDGLNTEKILADDDRLRQILENLFRNAIEHGGPGISVRVGLREGGFVVEDDGPGIPRAEQGNIFERGFSTVTDGTGFGLAIVQQIVDAHGWEISVGDSEWGGARFEITGVELVE